MLANVFLYLEVFVYHVILYESALLGWTSQTGNGYEFVKLRLLEKLLSVIYVTLDLIQ